MTPIRITELPALPARPVAGNKGTFGKILIIAGSRGMSGAPCLSGLGALRGGAGLVTVAVPQELQSLVAGLEPSYLTLGLPADSHARFAPEARAVLESIIPNYDCLAFGPGWGRSAALTELARWLFVIPELPIVVDADGLNALSQIPEVFGTAAGPRVFTPHPGEFSRLTGYSIEHVQQHREQLAFAFASQNQVVLLLKGAGTIITDGRRIAVNQTGNSGMATGGTGDVLTGLICALLGQGLPPFEAAQLGAHLHGLAGDLAAEELSRPGLIASDLPRYLPRAWKAYCATA